jgi:F-type H+/Na+-transporting ATPase subunit alpha
MPVEEQVVSIFAGTKGYIDDIPVVDVVRFEKELLEYVRTTHSSLLADIKSAGVPDGLAGAIEAFKVTFTPSTNEYAVDPTALDVDEVGDAKSGKTLATE